MIISLSTCNFNFNFVKRHYASNSAKMSGADEQKASSSTGNKKRRHDDLDDR